VQSEKAVVIEARLYFFLRRAVLKGEVLCAKRMSSGMVVCKCSTNNLTLRFHA
jgi:hypothetical protein